MHKSYISQLLILLNDKNIFGIHSLTPIMLNKIWCHDCCFKIEFRAYAYATHLILWTMTLILAFEYFHNILKEILQILKRFQEASKAVFKEVKLLRSLKLNIFETVASFWHILVCVNAHIYYRFYISAFQWCFVVYAQLMYFIKKGKLSFQTAVIRILIY